MSRLCPKCSAPPMLIGPEWVFSTMSSAKRGETLHQWLGCKHAQPLCSSDVLVRKADMQAIEDRWDAEARRLFAEYTARWTELERRAYARRLKYPEETAPTFVPELALTDPHDPTGDRPSPSELPITEDRTDAPSG